VSGASSFSSELLTSFFRYLRLVVYLLPVFGSISRHFFGFDHLCELLRSRIVRLVSTNVLTAAWVPVFGETTKELHGQFVKRSVCLTYIAKAVSDHSRHLVGLALFGSFRISVKVDEQHCAVLRSVRWIDYWYSVYFAGLARLLRHLLPFLSRCSSLASIISDQY